MVYLPCLTTACWIRCRYVEQRQRLPDSAFARCATTLCVVLQFCITTAPTCALLGLDAPGLSFTDCMLGCETGHPTALADLVDQVLDPYCCAMVASLHTCSAAVVM
jgi:hypothetical protein